MVLLRVRLPDVPAQCVPGQCRLPILCRQSARRSLFPAAAADRRVDGVDAAFEKGRRNLAFRDRSHGGQVDQGPDRLAVNQSVRADRHLPEDGRARQAREDDHRLVRHGARAVGDPGTERLQGRHGRGIPVMDEHVVAGLDQPLGHRPAHDADPDESNEFPALHSHLR